MKFSTLFASAACTALSFPALAQDVDHGDHDTSSEIVVTALRRDAQGDVLQGVSILTSAELTRELKPTIGETLTHQAGVSATSFGPNASRPVLRGFQGERVRVLSDGIGSFDVSNTSVDHAVVINPLNADRIEVLRGPTALLFGSSAIGGVVNVIDSRIPRSVPDEPVHVDGIATYGSAAQERSLGVRSDVRLSEQFVAHLDASYAKTDDLDIGGFLLTPALRATARASTSANIRALAGLKDTLPNSAARTWEVAGGLAWIGAETNAGLSVTRYDSLYGVPVRYSLDPAIVAEQVRLDVRQTRIDGRFEHHFDNGFLEHVHVRAGYADYHHDEVDDTGAIGTSFFAKGGEGRLELIQRDNNGWQGGFGLQGLSRTINIIGDEKFLPRATTSQLGIFTVQSLDRGPIRAEAGGRIEFSRQKAGADAILGNANLSRSFTSLSGSLGASYEVARGWHAGVNLSYTQRAPSAEELFANGPHAGTQAFEIGNPGFGQEKSKGIEATLRGKGDGYRVSASIYYSWFSNFLYEAPTGVIIDDLPVFQTLQGRAAHYGAEFEGSVRLATIGVFTLNLDSVADFTRATIRSAGPVPRIPAARLLGGLEAQSDKLDARVEVERVSGQARVAAFETTTPGYTMTNASLAWRPWGKDKPISLTLSCNNIFDVTARRHASFLKDYAPLSGRDIRVSVKLAI